jgi:transmembrane sensor
MSESALDPRIAQQAAEWFLLLQTGEATAADRADFERWLSSDPQCERAWRRAEHVGAKLGSIPANVGMPALRRRRDALKTLALMVAAPSAAWLAYRQTPLASWTADHRTDIGERRDFALPDDSHVWLNTDTSMHIDYGEHERLLQLNDGEILVQTAQDWSDVPRPFFVATRHGRIRALGTRFIVRRHDDATTVSVLEHAVAIRPRGLDAARIIEAGTTARFDSLAIESVAPTPAHADAWSNGVIFADGMRLDDFVTELNRYRPGVVRCHPDVAALKVSGAFQVRDTDPALRSLTRALPVRLIHRTRWWVSVEPV